MQVYSILTGVMTNLLTESYMRKQNAVEIINDLFCLSCGRKLLIPIGTLTRQAKLTQGNSLDRTNIVPQHFYKEIQQTTFVNYTIY
jgi:hypothetical protein